MTGVEDFRALLPQGLGERVEAKTGARIAEVRPRGGGGASREGAEIRLVWPDGTARDCYMNYDVNRAGAGDDSAFLREAAILRALSGPLADSGVRVAPFVAALPAMRALIAGKVAGEARFALAGDAAAQLALARDFMDQIARLHAIDPMRVEGLGPLLPIRDQIAERIARLRAATARGDDPLLMLVVDWLENHVPPEPERLVIVHGDAGPANFLFADGRVTALLDWELVHIGDPMADLAMICVRDLFQAWVPIPATFAAYASAGGAALDLDRVRYWRLLFIAGFASRTRFFDPDSPPPPNLGMNMVYRMVHRKVMAEAFGEAAGLAPPPLSLPDAEESPHARSFAIALDDLREVIVPRLADQQSAVKAKGLARLVKWWRAIDRYGAAFDAAERDEIAALLGTRFATAGAARAAFAEAIASHRLSRDAAYPIVHAQVMRQNWLMADAMGSLARTSFAPLV